MNIKLINPKNGKKVNQINNEYFDSVGNIIVKKNGVLIFVDDEGYVGNFGFQWNKFGKLQLDKFNNTNLSKDRFFAVTNWDKIDLTNENILEVGSGAGRFTQILLDYTNANIFSVDFSNAVDANYINNGPNDRLNIFKASIYNLPFEQNQFDKVICFGVLQHTPNPNETIELLIKMLKPGGELIVDFYPYNGFWTFIHSKYILRPILKRLPNDMLLKLIRINVGWMISCNSFFERVYLGRLINRFIPICDVSKTIPNNLSKEEIKEWVTLDTFDMFSPAFDFPQKLNIIKKIFEQSKMEQVVANKIKYGDNMQVTFVKGIKSPQC